MRKSRLFLVVAAAAAAVAAVFFLRPLSDETPEPEVGRPAQKAAPSAAAGSRQVPEVTPATATTKAEGAVYEAEPEQELTAEEKAEAAEQARVDAFDALVDRWMEPSEKAVTMEDVDSFAAAFRAVPEKSREDGIRRALNLVPDENALLLAGVLMDKSQPKDIVELVFNDVLNRSEEVKLPILRQIFKDRSHPCWADTAWIFDVTGEPVKN